MRSLIHENQSPYHTKPSMIIQLSKFGRNELKNANSHARTELRRSQKCSLWKIDWTEMTSQGLPNSAGSPLGKKKKGILKERRKGHLFARTSSFYCKVRSERSILLWIECLPKLLPLFFWTTLVLLNQLKAGLFFLDGNHNLVKMYPCSWYLTWLLRMERRRS